MQWVKPALLLALLCGCAVPSQAQVGTPEWHFDNREQVEAAARKYKLDLRESYNIILSAKRQGMLNSVVRAYEAELPKSPFDTPPQLASSFAFAHEMMHASVRWDWPRDKARGLTKLTPADGIRITFYRDKALEALPKSPEVLLEYAIYAIEQDQREKALNLTTKALLYAPQWSELHWWHAKALEYRLIAIQDRLNRQEEPRYGALILKALDTAQQLDPGFKQENLLRRASAYSYMGRYKEALAAFDAYIRYKPGYRKRIGERSYMAIRQAWSQKDR